MRFTSTDGTRMDSSTIVAVLLMRFLLSWRTGWKRRSGCRSPYEIPTHWQDELPSASSGCRSPYEIPYPKCPRVAFPSTTLPFSLWDSMNGRAALIHTNETVLPFSLWDSHLLVYQITNKSIYVAVLLMRFEAANFCVYNKQHYMLSFSLWDSEPTEEIIEVPTYWLPFSLWDSGLLR